MVGRYGIARKFPHFMQVQKFVATPPLNTTTYATPLNLYVKTRFTAYSS